MTRPEGVKRGIEFSASLGGEGGRGGKEMNDRRQMCVRGRCNVLHVTVVFFTRFLTWQTVFYELTSRQIS